MIWFKLKELERRLANGEVTERTGFHYLLTIMIFFSIAKLVPDDSPFPNFWWDLGDIVLGILVLILGMNSTFKINGKDGNKEFLKRFLSLSFVIYLRLAIVFMFLYLLYKIIMFVIPIDLYLLIDGIVSENISQLLLSTGVSLLYYFLLIRSFKRVNAQQNVEARKFSAA